MIYFYRIDNFKICFMGFAEFLKYLFKSISIIECQNVNRNFFCDFSKWIVKRTEFL